VRVIVSSRDRRVQIWVQVWVGLESHQKQVELAVYQREVCAHVLNFGSQILQLATM
jgi:hypothetical protein